jgi:phosphoesterase RecJ-like protein
MMTETITFYHGDRCGVAVLPADVTWKYGVTEEDLDGIASFVGRIEGVIAGVTVRARSDNTYRVSLRTMSPVDASAICAGFGGGGHMNAAGCTMSGDLYDVINDLVCAVRDEFVRHELI